MTTTTETPVTCPPSDVKDMIIRWDELQPGDLFVYSQLPRPERPKLPKPAEPWHCTPESITLSLRQGQLVMARKLRRNMTSGQLARLAELLTEEC